MKRSTHTLKAQLCNVARVYKYIMILNVHQEPHEEGGEGRRQIRNCYVAPTDSAGGTNMHEVHRVPFRHIILRGGGPSTMAHRCPGS